MGIRKPVILVVFAPIMFGIGLELSAPLHLCKLLLDGLVIVFLGLLIMMFLSWFPSRILCKYVFLFFLNLCFDSFSLLV